MNETAEQKKIRQRQEDLARLRGLRPIDDDFMRCIFRDNIPLVQLVLRIMTGISDLEITKLEIQKDIKRLVGARSICFDAYGNDAKGRKYNLEVERSDQGSDVHRARYHSSVIDIENLDANQKFSELPETYTIFLTEKDKFGAGKAIYHIERVNLETKELFNDGEHILYVNGEFRDDSDIGKLMHDFSCPNPADMNYKLMKDTTSYYKENPKGVEVMCRAFEEVRDEAKAEGKAEGLAEGKAEGLAEGIAKERIANIRTLMESLKINAQQAMDLLMISSSEQKELSAKI